MNKTGQCDSGLALNLSCSGFNCKWTSLHGHRRPTCRGWQAEEVCVLSPRLQQPRCFIHMALSLECTSLLFCQADSYWPSGAISSVKSVPFPLPKENCPLSLWDILSPVHIYISICKLIFFSLICSPIFLISCWTISLLNVRTMIFHPYT